MTLLDGIITRLFIWARHRPLLYRFTLGLKILLAVAFIPTGAVKVLGLRFTSINDTHEVGTFFEILYQSGHYWKFLGFVQILAGILILSERTSAIGSILFLGIISNIFFITISYDFDATPLITGGMLLACLWLLFWSWHQIRTLLIAQSTTQIEIPHITLKNWFERVVYTSGFINGLLVFSVLRGLSLPLPIFYISISAMLFSFILSIILGIINRKSIS